MKQANKYIDYNELGTIYEQSLDRYIRKHGGIFYTPKYITNYIVENTIGKLCNEKKTELQIKGLLIDETFYVQTHRRAISVQTHGRASLQKLNQKGKQLFETLQTYKTWLLTIKILDPACGSGAFLNAALDFLIKEHQEIDDLISELTGDKMRRHINYLFIILLRISFICSSVNFVYFTIFSKGSLLLIISIVISIILLSIALWIFRSSCFSKAFSSKYLRC